ncbi:MAG: ABC transporter permease subunit, partial [Xanthobacteraceae bacterium]
MTSSALTAPRRVEIRWRPVVARYTPVVVIVLAVIALWYVAAVFMNIGIVRDGFERNSTPYTATDLIAGTWSAERPLLPAPHQILATFADDVFGWPVTSPRSLVYHSWVTLSATFVGFLLGATFGVVLAVLIVHARTLQKSLLPWIICSQMVPILAVAPIIIVVLGSIGLRGLLPKAIISAYLCFFPVTIGVVKGLSSPD